jgi:hypothetical protein
VQNRLLFALPVVPLLLAAAFWNPAEDFTKYDSSRWIGSGLEHERLGDLKAAERDLLEAAQIDRLYLPRWTLAGFYFRRNDPDNFWRWTREALAVGRHDLGALFDLCWKMPAGSDKIWAIALPHSKATWDEYLYYLISTGRWPAAATTAERIANEAEIGDRPLLTNYCDLALEHNDVAGAIAVWGVLRKRGLLPFAADSLLTNGDFRSAPTGHGFDWRPLPHGLANPFRPGEASFTFNGFEHEREVLLEQPLALDSQLMYELRFEYKTANLAVKSGVHWVAGSDASIDLSTSEWTLGNLEFSGAAPSLALIYQRPSGSTIADGTLSIRNVSVIPR